LASAIREHSKIANEPITGFCDKATSVLEGLRDLQQKLKVRVRDPDTNQAAENTPPLPELIRKGPAKLDDPL
jgi:hypothetical protein